MRSLISEGLRVRGVRRGSRARTPVPQGGVKLGGRMCWISCAWPQAVQLRVSFVLFLCPAWFAEPRLMFRAPEQKAEVVWVMKMLRFGSSAPQENLSPQERHHTDFVPLCTKLWINEEKIYWLRSSFFLFFFLIFLFTNHSYLVIPQMFLYCIPTDFFSYLLTLLKCCSS